MNLLLVEPGELSAERICTLADRRAEHLRRIIGAVVGSTVRAGIVRGQIGTAEVLADTGSTMTLRLTLTGTSPPPLPVELVLAIPRPKVLTRVIEAAAAFAVTRIDLTNAWRVDRSYLSSPRLAPEALAYALRFGAEQGATTHVPELAVHDRLMTLLDARWPGPPATRLIAHPGAAPIETAVTGGPVALAIGPEGGWIEREVETFVARGFIPVSIGTPILRVETAVAAALGQLALLLRITQR